MEQANREGVSLPEDVEEAIAEMRRDYEHQLDARYAAARGYVDAVVYPEETRDVLAMAFRAACHNPGPHLGPFVLPPQAEIVR